MFHKAVARLETRRPDPSLRPRRRFLPRAGRTVVPGPPADPVGSVARPADPGAAGPAAGPAAAAAGPGLGFPPEILLSDTTLCDGELAPGVAFSAQEKLRIAERLALLGVPLIEAGFPAVSAEEVAAVRGIVEAELGVAVQAIARPLKHDIDMAVHSGAHRIALCVGTSDAHVERWLRTDRAHLLAQIQDAVGYARKSGRQIVFTAEDATRTDPDFLLAALCAAADAGADAIGLADTAGVATPESIADLVRRAAAGCPLPITVHCRNDLGLATANTIAALGAGATGAQCSVLGLGGRAGNTCLEELALALEVGYHVRTGLDLRGLAPLARQVAALAGQVIGPGRPVVGRNAFLHESGLRTSAVVHEPSTYEPYPPELIGRGRGFTIGKHTGPAGAGHILARRGLTLTDSELAALLGEADRRGFRGEPLRENELFRLAQRLFAGPDARSEPGNAPLPTVSGLLAAQPAGTDSPAAQRVIERDALNGAG
jgi:isopropylmalate/homocitrate/citramalate synthase